MAKTKTFDPNSIVGENLLFMQGKRSFKIPENIDELIRQNALEVFSAGLFLGESDRRGFNPSIAALQKFFEIDTEKKIAKLNEKGEWMFICGRDAFTKNLIEPPKAEIGDVVWVTNIHDELIGLGTLENKQVKHLRDIGEFLRREK